MSVYKLKSEWTPIKEKRGILRNLSTFNMEYAITDGAEPDNGAILIPDDKVEFDLLPQRKPVQPPDIPFTPHHGFHDTDYYYTHFHGNDNFQESHEHPKTLFIRALGVSPDDRFDGVAVDNLEPDNMVNYDVFGLADWAAGKLYVEGQYVVFDKHLYYCNTEHISNGTSPDLTKFECICNDVENVTISDATLTVTFCDGSTRNLTVNNVAHASSADTDGAGNNIINTYATKTAVAGDLANINLDITTKYNALHAVDEAIKTDLINNYLRKDAVGSTFIKRAGDTMTGALTTPTLNTTSSFNLKAGSSALVGATDGSVKLNGENVLTTPNLFTNLPPKVGFLDDTTVQLYGAFNMSWKHSREGACIFHDAEGREVMFITSAASNYNTVYKCFRASRMSVNDDFIYENEPIRPAFMTSVSGYDSETENIYVAQMYKITDEYTILNIVGETFGGGTPVLALTNGSGSPRNWSNSLGWVKLNGAGISNYKEITRVVYNNNVYYLTPSGKQGYDFIYYETADASKTLRTASISYEETLVDSGGNHTAEYNRYVVNADRSLTIAARSTNYSIYMNIYKVEEDFENHTITVLSSSSQKMCTFGQEMWGTNTVWNSETGYMPCFGEISSCYLSEHDEIIIDIEHTAWRYFVGSNKTAVTDSSGNGLFVFSVKFAPSDLDTANYFVYDKSRPDQNIFIRNPYVLYEKCDCIHGHWSGVRSAMTYSQLTDTLYYAVTVQDNYTQVAYRYDLASKLSEYRASINPNFLALRTTSFYIITPDTAPWSKRLSGMLIINNSYLLNANNSKGQSISYIEPVLAVDANNEVISTDMFTAKTGRWAKVPYWNTNLSSSLFTCCRDVSDTSTYGGSKWYSTQYDSSTKTLTAKQIVCNNTITLNNGETTDKAIRISDDITASVAMSSVGNVFDGTVRYFGYADGKSSLGTGFIVISFRDNVYSDGTIESVTDDLAYGQISIVRLDGTYTTYNLGTDMSHVNQDGADYNYKKVIACDTKTMTDRNYCSIVDNGRSSNLFIDSDGKIYLRAWIYYSPGSSRYNPVWWCIDVSNNVVTHYPNWVYWGMTKYPVGYTNEWGYYRSTALDDLGRTTCDVKCTKDKWGSDTSKPNTMHALLTDNCYHKRMYAASSIGLVAYLQRTALYLGGYFSYIDEQEVYLTEGDNYIYLSRSNITREVAVEVQKKKIGVVGASQFSRILIAYIKCTNGRMVQQKNYEINYYGN